MDKRAAFSKLAPPFSWVDVTELNVSYYTLLGKLYKSKFLDGVYIGAYYGGY